MPAVAADQAMAVVQADAVRAYRDLSGCCIRLTLEDDGWHVEYDLNDLRLKGGGPRYLIDRVTGTIVSKTFEQ